MLRTQHSVSQQRWSNANGAAACLMTLNSAHSKPASIVSSLAITSPDAEADSSRLCWSPSLSQTIRIMYVITAIIWDISDTAAQSCSASDVANMAIHPTNACVGEKSLSLHHAAFQPPGTRAAAILLLHLTCQGQQKQQLPSAARPHQQDSIQLLPGLDISLHQWEGIIQLFSI